MAVNLPLPYTVRVRTRTAGPVDDFGNETTTWVEADWRVHGIAPGAMDEPGQANRDLSLVAWTIYGPAPSPVAASSEVRLPGDTAWLKVDGTPKDWTLGPWEHPTAGVVVELRRADG